MTVTDTHTNPSWNEKVASVLSHVFLVGMMLSIAVSAIQFGERLIPGWEGGYLLALTLVVTLGAILGKRYLQGVSAFQGDWFVYRTAELVVLAVFIRLWLYGLHGLAQLQSDLSIWGFQVINYFKDPEFLTILVFSLLIWVISSAFSGDLMDLEGDITIVDRDTFRFALQDRKFAQARIVNRVFSVGILLVILSALIRADIGILWQDRPTVQGGGVNILVYFMLGMLLFSLSHFSSLRALWIWDRYSIGQNIARNWLLYGVLFLVGLGVLAAFLPTRYSLGFLDLITYLLSIIFYGINILFSFLWSLVYLLIYFLSMVLSLFQSGNNAPAERPPQLQPPPLAPLPPAPATSPWQTFTSIVFWVVFLAAVYYAFYYYIRQHQGRFSWIREIAIVKTLSKGWRWVREILSGWTRVMMVTVQEGVDRFRRINLPDSGEGLKPIRLINPLRLSPRLRVIFFYLALTRRGRREGLPRRPGQTPYEYARSLEEKLPEVDTELGRLTEAFVQARYSRKEIDKDQARQARDLWGRIQRAFRLR